MKESIAGIVKEMREYAEHRDYDSDGNMDVSHLRRYADRIEAAWQLDRSDAMKTAMMAKCEVCHYVQGNKATLRKALEDTLYLAKKYVAQSPATSAVIFENGKPAREIDYLQAVKNAETALAAPARNCDRFATADDASDFYFEHVPDNGNIIDGYPEWLFATELIYGDAKAANKEGGKKQ